MKKVLTLVLAIIMLCGMVIPVCASDDGIMPLFDNIITANVHFKIDSNGKAIADLSYIGYQNYATGGTVTCKIQKKVSSDWVDVKDAAWKDEVSGFMYNKEHTFQLTERGTYQLVYTIEVRGKNNTKDIINDTIEKTY